MGAMLNGHAPEKGTCVGCVFSPVHVYQKGHLWKSEGEANKQLANARCNLDHPFVLPFQNRADERDHRSCGVGFIEG